MRLVSTRALRDRLYSVFVIANSVVAATGEAAPSSAAQVAEHEWNSRVSQDQELIERGRRLRIAIDAEYKRLEKAGEIKGPGQGHGGNDISWLVEMYIPVGSSVDDGEKILSSAGFTLIPRGEGTIMPGDYRVIAQIPFYRTQFLIGRTLLVVGLTPPGPGDYSIVTKVSAGFVKIML